MAQTVVNQEFACFACLPFPKRFRTVAMFREKQLKIQHVNNFNAIDVFRLKTGSFKREIITRRVERPPVSMILIIIIFSYEGKWYRVDGHSIPFRITIQSFSIIVNFLSGGKWNL